MHRGFRLSFVLWLLLGTLGLHAEEVTLAHQGLTLRAELRLPEGKGIDDGPLVLMTHGTLAHGRMEIMQGLQEQLAARGYGSLAITLSFGKDRREGMYDCAASHDHRHTDALGEMGGWLAWLKSQGVKEVVLLGHSRGGNQTAWFAAEHDDPAISRVVLIAPMTWSEKGASEAYRRDHGKDLRAVLGRAEKLIKEGKGTTPLKGVGFLHCQQATVMPASFVDYYRTESRFDTPTLIKSMRKPVLVIAGSEDTLVPNLPEKMAALADGMKVRLQIVDGADHFFRDLYVDEVADHVADFVGSHGE